MANAPPRPNITDTTQFSAAQRRLDKEADAGESAGKSRLNTSVLARITQMAFRHRIRMAVAIIATIAAAVFQLFVPQFLGRAVDQAQGLLGASTASGVEQNVAEAALLSTALLLLGTSVLRGLATMMQNYQGEAVGQIIGYELRLAYYQKLQSLSFSWRDRVHSGDLMTRGMLDVEGVRLWVSTGVLRMILLSIIIGGGAIILIDIDPTLAAVALAMVPIIGVRASIARLKLREAWLSLQEEMSLLTRAMEENLAGIRVVRAFAAEAFELARFHVISERARKISARRIGLFVSSTTQMTFVYFLVMGLVLLIGGQKVLAGTMTLGQLTEFLAFMLILQMPIRQIGWMINSIARASTCGGRLFAVLDLVPSIANAPDAQPLNITEGLVKFENVSFGYAGERKGVPALTGISFEVRPGHMIGIVGPPGSGKSTLATLLGRYYDIDNGCISIDGQDIRDITLASLRSAVALVQQQPFLFTSSLDHNIAYGAPWADRASIERSAGASQLHDHIKRLPEGYGTLVGERGVSLSGGQRQRLAIARSILPESRVIIFDDSTAAVDAATEQRIRHAIQDLIAERAIIVIAHRLTSLMHASEILFLEEGRIVERGNHAELVALNGQYAALYRLQTTHADLEELGPEAAP
jgi:ATP-binding cassette subfamily B multidrug efflux pump